MSAADLDSVRAGLIVNVALAALELASVAVTVTVPLGAGRAANVQAKSPEALVEIVLPEADPTVHPEYEPMVVLPNDMVTVVETPPPKELPVATMELPTVPLPTESDSVVTKKDGAFVLESEEASVATGVSVPVDPDGTVNVQTKRP
jgi:hypothetical protein